MGLLKNFFSQTRKPEGILGKMMIKGMNSGHAEMADWGMDYIKGLRPSRTVDLGCGGGRNAAELLKRFPQTHVTAVDYSPLSVERTAEYNRAEISAGRCAAEQQDVSKLTLPEGSFELATAFETVYFWPGLAHCFAEVARVLGDGGHFLIVNESDGRDAVSRRFEKIIDGMRTYTAAEIEAALQEAGFSEVNSEHHESKPWIAVIARR